MASSSKLSHAASVSNTGVPAALPADALFEVLLRLPAKDLCRLRAVCRSWRALTYDLHFAAEHKSRHAEPLFAVTFRDGDVRGVAIVSLSGQILRRIRFGSDRIELLLTHLDRLFVFRWCKPSLSAWVLNPATAAPLTLPGLHSDEFVGTCIEQRFDFGPYVMHNCKMVTYAFGQVVSTGDYKVLRISHPHPDNLQPRLCDVITLDGTSQGRWRRKQNPPGPMSEIMEYLAVNGVVYFLDYGLMEMEPTSIAPFDLDTEKWMPTLRGPEPLRSVEFGAIFGRELSLANLNASLVIIDNDFFAFNLDLWFLVDHRRGLWVKMYRLSVEQPFCHHPCPLLILDDGRIVFFYMGKRLLQCYDPSTGKLADVLDIGAMGLAESQSIGVYTGSLLM
ncbi:unnamed protein product [Urochloa decumbens]|uniref:F-box domain-containing protein n=1 Tax=Urochloa decumbens TaxID=240449 RepID=A0ABC9C1L8_9POAL